VTIYEFVYIGEDIMNSVLNPTEWDRIVGLGQLYRDSRCIAGLVQLYRDSRCIVGLGQLYRDSLCSWTRTVVQGLTLCGWTRTAVQGLTLYSEILYKMYYVCDKW
jgi:hypothetical protein